MLLKVAVGLCSCKNLRISGTQYFTAVNPLHLVMKNFRHYLLNKNFKLVTDCVVFKGTTTIKDVPQQVAQWIIYLQYLDISVQHQQNGRMSHIDCLSRYPLKVYNISTEHTASKQLSRKMIT